MNKSTEKSRKSLALELIFLAVLIGLTFWWLLRDCDIHDLCNTVRGADYRLIGLGVLCIFFYIFCGGSSVAILFRGMGERMGPLRCLKYHLIEFFFSAITPSSTGGQPVEVMAMRADGYRLTESTAVLLVVAVLYKLAMLALFLGLYLCNFAFLHAQVMGMWFLFLLGLLLNVLLIAGIILGLYAQRGVQRLCAFVLRLLTRLRIVKTPERALEKLNTWLDSFHACARFMRTHPWTVLKSFAVILLQRVLYLLIPWCVYLALGLRGVTMWQIMGLQLLLSVSVEMIPLPGAVGISESVFLVLYDAIFGARFLYSAVMLSRGIAYYLPLIVSGLVALGARLKYLRDHRARAAQ